jgi:hypothetical protein
MPMSTTFTMMVMGVVLFVRVAVTMMITVGMIIVRVCMPRTVTVTTGTSMMVGVLLPTVAMTVASLSTMMMMSVLALTVAVT